MKNLKNLCKKYCKSPPRILPTKITIKIATDSYNVFTIVQLWRHQYLNGVRVRPVCFERVDGPHGQVTDQKKGDNLTARFLLHLVSVVSKSGNKLQSNSVITITVTTNSHLLRTNYCQIFGPKWQVTS